MSEKITLEDLKKHCIKTIEACEQFRKLPNVVVTDDRRNQEHKMVLQLIEEHEQRQSTDAVSREAVIGLYERFRPSLATHVTEFGDALKDLPTVTPEKTTITYKDCSEAMLKMWIDNVLTDGQYNKIMDKLNAKHMEDMRGVSECSEENKN